MWAFPFQIIAKQYDTGFDAAVIEGVIGPFDWMGEGSVYPALPR